MFPPCFSCRSLRLFAITLPPSPVGTKQRSPPRKWWEARNLKHRAPYGRHRFAGVCRPTGLGNERASLPTASAVGYVLPSLRDFGEDHREEKARRSSSRYAKNLQISSTEDTENTEQPQEFAQGLARSFRTTAPPFITNFTFSSCLMSSSGFPETAIISANRPGSMAPT
jgi:hypothetical protein